MKLSELSYTVIHLVNLCLHVACVLALFIVLRLITRRLWPSALTAALFAIHPQNTETVATLQHCTYSLNALFCLIALAVYVKNRPVINLKTSIIIFVCWTASLLSHPSSIHLPVLFLITDFWINDGNIVRHGINNKTGAENNSYKKMLWKTVLIPKMPFFIYGLLWLGISLGYMVAVSSTANFSLVSFLKKIPFGFVSYASYLQSILWPFSIPSKEINSNSLHELSVFITVASALALIIITVISFLLANKHRWLPVGWLWFLISLAPFILVHVNQETIASSRYAYFPAIGIFIIISWGGEEAIKFRIKRYKPIAASLAGLLLTILIITAHHQTGYWKNFDGTIQLQIKSASPLEKKKIFAGYGCLMLSLGKVPEAIINFQRTLAVDDRCPETHNLLGLALAIDKKPQQAYRHFTRALVLKPDYIAAHNNLANLMVDLNRTEEAIIHYKEALRLDPNQAETHNNLATALFQAQDIPAAIRHLEKALTLKPDYDTARQNLNRILAAEEEEYSSFGH